MPEPSAIVLVRLSAHEGEEHLELARRQAGRQLARALRHAVARRGEHRVDRLRVKASLLRLAQELRLRLGRVESRPVRPRLAHGAVAVRRRQDWAA